VLFLRIWKNILGVIFILIAVITVALFIRANAWNISKDSQSKTTILEEQENETNNVSELQIFNSQKESTFDGAEIKAEAAIAVNLDSGVTLYAKNIHAKLYPASLTKLMTALLLSENRNKNELLTYTAFDKAEPSNKMDFPQGSKVTADNVMKGMLIFSANDFATMVAENLSGSVDGFASLMNRKAGSLGMKDTNFANSNGLQNSNHYSSACDISILAREVYRNSWIMDTIEMPSALVTTSTGKGITVYNTNQALDKEGCFAGKTGHTDEAGYCLVAYYHKNGESIVCVILKSPNENDLYSDVKSIIDQF
jgi:D-alanyl-D-alanine carboxypeptidase